MKILRTIRAWFAPKMEEFIESDEFDWCIVGNVVEAHYWGEEKEIRSGSKHFRPGAKLYCLPDFPGMAYESIRVVGKPRKQKRLINVVINTRLIKNFRIQRVYHPEVRSAIQEHWFYQQKDANERSREMKQMLKTLSSYTEEISP